MTELVGLVVDDDDLVRSMLADTLRRDGMHMLEASSGRQALSLVGSCDVSFVLTDIDMPDIDGLELCRQLRRSPATLALPIVVVSGRGGTQFDEARDAGCDAVLAKPCSPAELVTTIRRLLENPTTVAPPVSKRASVPPRAP